LQTYKTRLYRVWIIGSMEDSSEYIEASGFKLAKVEYMKLHNNMVGRSKDIRTKQVSVGQNITGDDNGYCKAVQDSSFE